MIIRYCPTCWVENAREATVCASCGASLVEPADKDYAARLIDAIGHREPTRAVLAIELLGRMHESRAVAGLLKRLARRPDSMDVTTAAAVALGQIGDRAAVPGLAAVLLDEQRPLPARLAAAEALIALGGSAAQAALDAAEGCAPLPVLLRRVLAQRHVGEPQ